MRIVVTGGYGMVGKALQELVLPNDYWTFLHRKDVDLLDKNKVLQVFSDLKPDVVVHLAAKHGGLYMNMENNKSLFIENETMNMNVITAAEHVGVKRLIAMLSTGCFPNPAPALPLTEDMLHKGPVATTHEGFAESKRMLELHCRLSTVLDTICLISTNVFGPWDNFSLATAHVIPALIHKCHVAKQNNDYFVVSGKGIARKQFIYSGDLAKIIHWAVYKHERIGHETYICAPSVDEEHSIHEIAVEIAKSMDYDHQLYYDTPKADGRLKKTANNAKLSHKMGDQLVFSDFKTNLHETIDWFINNFEIAKH